MTKQIEWICLGCQRTNKPYALKSRCFMQIKTNRWNGFCSRCCCLNNIRGKECEDPSGLGWVRK